MFGEWKDVGWNFEEAIEVIILLFKHSKIYEKKTFVREFLNIFFSFVVNYTTMLIINSYVKCMTKQNIYKKNIRNSSF
jgi:hypothetical protein